MADTQKNPANLPEPAEPGTVQATVSTPPAPMVVGAVLKTLPWESRTEFMALRRELYNAYQPVGPLECHLLDELVMTMWRKRRFHEAENAAIREKAASLISRSDSPYENNLNRRMAKAALLGLNTETLPDSPDMEAVLTDGASDPKAAEKARKAVAYWTDLRGRLLCGRTSAKVVVRDALTDWRDEWRDGLRNEEYERNASGVAEFIKDYPLQQAKLDLLKAHSGELRDHVAGRALLEHTKAGDLLLKFELHLDNKTRGTLEMLLNLQRIRMGR